MVDWLDGCLLVAVFVFCCGLGILLAGCWFLWLLCVCLAGVGLACLLGLLLVLLFVICLLCLSVGFRAVDLSLGVGLVC